MSLRLDWCSHEAAKFAVEHWHYSRRMVPSKTAKLGVWEGEKFVGALVFGVGATNHSGRPYGLTQQQVCELVRVALTRHETPVSKVVAVAIRFLRKHCPNLRLVISYADPTQGHHGGIYQAGNWVYVGQAAGDRELFIGGRWRHRRTVNHTMSSSMVGKQCRPLPGKHKYLMPLDNEMREKIGPLAKPYPKRERSAGSGTPDHQSGGGGANPTRSLEPV